jgi:hypothetical protein
MANSSQQAAERRASWRRELRSDARVECRKGMMGLGPNLVRAFLDLSETGIRLVVSTPLNQGQIVEVVVGGTGVTAVKRLANVVWTLPAVTGGSGVGLRFQEPLPFAVTQQLTRPSRAKK